MATKGKSIPAEASSNLHGGDGRRLWLVKPGVDHVDGKPLAGARSVRLTDIEAAFDRQQGRIALAGEPSPADWSPPEAVDDRMPMAGEPA